MDGMTPTFMTIQEVAFRWGCHANTVRRAVADGSLTATKLRGRVKVPRSAVLAYEQAMTQRGVIA